MTIESAQRRSLRFRGRSFLALVLTPEMPASEWLDEIDAWLARSPMFFNGKPLILDASKLALPRADFVALIASLTERQIEIMGIEGANPAWLGAGLPPLLTGGWKPAAVDTGATVAEAPPVKSVLAPAADPVLESVARAAQPFPSLLVEEPVRSGQSIHFQEGDVTVLGSVASGAEIIAGGSIHVYGTLRGRALAGAYGNAHARIFTRRLEAELLSIDGLYKVAEDLEPRLRKQPVHAWLDGDAMKISVLN